MNSKLHAVCDGIGRPIIFLLTEGQMSDHMGPAMIFPVVPDAGTLIGDKGSDSGAFRKALIERGITPCIPLAPSPLGTARRQLTRYLRGC